MAGSASPSRYIDLAISIRIADVERDKAGRPHWKPGGDVELERVGGRWDRRRKRWSPANATSTVIFRFHRGQEESARWLVDWLQRFARNDWEGAARMWSALLIGGRRSGKTYVCCAIMIVFAILVPKSLLWAISPTLETGDELDQAFQELLPRRWYRRRQAKTGRSTTFTFANGSRILLKSAVKPQRLKAGRVDLALLNEAQELAQLAYVKLRAAIADRGGLVLLAANPPDTAAGRWVEKHYYGLKAREIDGVVFELDPRSNPWINYEALASIAKESDEKTFQRDVLGLFPPIGDVVFHAWDERENWRDPTRELVDITAEVARRAVGRSFGYIVGMDFQRIPAMVAAIHRVFRDPETGEELLWVVDEVVVDEADENDLVDALEALPVWRDGNGFPKARKHSDGYRGWALPADQRAHPAHCGCVIDASGFFQSGDHTQGRTSDRFLRARGWVHLFTPQKDSDKNPAIVERMKTGNMLMKSANGRRRLFVAKHCVRTAEALRCYENKNGSPNRRSVYAHIVDAVTYVAYRLYGRPKVVGTGPRYHAIQQPEAPEVYPR